MHVKYSHIGALKKRTEKCSTGKCGTWKTGIRIRRTTYFFHSNR